MVLSKEVGLEVSAIWLRAPTQIPVLGLPERAPGWSGAFMSLVYSEDFFVYQNLIFILFLLFTLTVIFVKLFFVSRSLVWQSVEKVETCGCLKLVSWFENCNILIVIHIKITHNAVLPWHATVSWRTFEGSLQLPR